MARRTRSADDTDPAADDADPPVGVEASDVPPLAHPPASRQWLRFIGLPLAGVAAVVAVSSVAQQHGQLPVVRPVPTPSPTLPMLAADLVFFEANSWMSERGTPGHPMRVVVSGQLRNVTSGDLVLHAVSLTQPGAMMNQLTIGAVRHTSDTTPPDPPPFLIPRGGGEPMSFDLEITSCAKASTSPGRLSVDAEVPGETQRTSLVMHPTGGAVDTEEGWLHLTC